MDLQGLLEKTAAGMGYEVVDIEMSPRARLLRVLIDKPDKPGGVTVEDCSKVSNQLSHLMFVENIDYDRLEVSSPGLDRPLTKPEHFARFTGHEVQIKLRVPVSGRRNFGGILLGLEGDSIRLQVAAGAGTEEVSLELASVDKARLVPKFD